MILEISDGVFYAPERWTPGFLTNPQFKKTIIPLFLVDIGDSHWPRTEAYCLGLECMILGQPSDLYPFVHDYFVNRGLFQH